MITLKQILEKIKNLYDNLFYKEGESATINRVSTAGFITNGQKSILFQVPLDKNLTDDLDVTITGGTIWIRTISGTYISDQEGILTNKTVAIDSNKRSISVRLNYLTAQNVTNNTPVGVDLMNLTLKFTKKV